MGNNNTIRPKKLSVSDEAITGCCIRDITGITDENAVKAILTTGATRSEIRQAYDYCFENFCVKPSHMRPMDGRIRKIIDILKYGRDFLD